MKKSKPAVQATTPKTVETWPGAFKAIAIRSLSFGKFWQICVTAMILMVLYKLEPGEVTKLAHEILADNVVCMLGWLAALVSTLAGVALVRFTRSTHQMEIARLSAERSALQERLLGGKVERSNLVTNTPS